MKTKKRKTSGSESVRSGRREKPVAPAGTVTLIHPSMKAFTGYCLYKIAFRFRDRMDALLSPFGVVAPQCGIMSLLKSEGPMTQIELGRHMWIDKATMVRFLDGLEKKNLVIRVSDPNDRRAKRLKITPAGGRLLKHVLKAKATAEDEIFAPLSSSERKSLKSLIAKLATQPT